MDAGSIVTLEEEYDLSMSTELEGYLTGAPAYPHPPPGCIPEYLAQIVVVHPNLDMVCGIPCRKILDNKVRVPPGCRVPGCRVPRMRASV